jgi:dethiobiotin synthetase
LGTLNHTFLTLEALRKRQIPIFGVIMNGPRNESNRKAIEKYGKAEVLGELEPLDEVNSQSLTEAFEKIF